MAFLPIMNKGRTERVLLPNLSGGINPGSVGAAVADNQLTDCLNVWFKGGEVITRPKLLKVTEPRSFSFDFSSYQSIITYVHGKKYKISVDKDLKVIISSADIINNDNRFFEIFRITLNHSTLENIKYILYKGNSCLCSNIGAYLILQCDKIDTSGNVTKNTRRAIGFNFDDKRNSFNADEIDLDSEYIKETHNFYVPQILVNGQGNLAAKLPRTDGAEMPKISQLEAPNLINGFYNCTFTTDSISESFKLPILPNGRIDIKIDISIAAKGSAVEWVSVDSSQSTYSKTENTQKTGFFSLRPNLDHNPPIYYYKENILKFTISENSDESNEGYYIDGTFPYYTPDGQYKNRCYYRSFFKAKVNRETGEIYFPFEKSTVKKIYMCDAISNVYDEFQSNHLQNIAAVDSITGLDNNKKTTINLKNAYLVYFDYKDDFFEKSVTLKNENNDEIYTVPRFTVKTTPQNMALPKNGDIKNNISITVYNKTVTEDFEKIVNCNISENYGGGNGINQGTRSFVSGNSNRIYFTDIDKPFYFPENCDIKVGSENDKITAFAKLGGYLVIFKNNSIFYTYEKALEFTAADIENQKIIDITSQYMYQVNSVNSEVGCDLPNTIQLCLNKLIFANSDGNVYVLNSLNNYSKNNIYVVSGLVKDRLQKYKEDDFKSSFALDYQGYYMLFINDMSYILDYRRNAYKYIASYTSESSVNKYGLFSWWIWQFPEHLKSGVSTDNTISLISDKSGILTFTNQPETECESYVVSKFFDFSAPDFYKSIERFNVEIGNNCDSTIYIEFFTDKGEKNVLPIEIYNTGDKGTAEYLKEKCIYPMIKSCRKFGFKISSKGPLALTSVIISYSLKGGVKNGI